MSTLPPIYAGLVDDAALFPPGNAPLADAVPAHRRHRSAWYGALVGPFLCPASALADLAGQVDQPLGVGVIVDTGTGGIEAAVRTVLDDPNLDLRAVEVPLRGEPLTDAARRAILALDRALLDAGGPDGVPAYIEVPLAGPWRPALDEIAVADHRAKLRTGGTTAEAFPTETDVAAFILACLETDVPFKFTAGLHRAVRHTSAEGWEQHGFVNALLAVAGALEGGGDEALAATLADRDSARIAARVHEIPAARAASVRTWLTSYGSCSIDEPLDDLIGLGLVASPLPAKE